MPFQYDYRPSPYVGALGDLMLRSGDIRARAAEIVAAAQARAEEQRGAAWAGAATNIGRTVSALPGQIADARAAQTQQQFADIKLRDAQALEHGRGAVDAMMQGEQLPAGAQGPRQQSYLTEEGLFDIPKMTTALASGGMASHASDLLKGAEQINDSVLKHQGIQQQQQVLAQKAADAHTVLLGDLADGTLKLVKAGVPIGQAMDMAIQPALATGRLQPPDYAKFKAQLAPLNPEQQTAALTSLLDQAARIAPAKTLAEGATEVDRYGRAIAKGEPKPQRPVVVAPGSIAVNPETGATVATGPPKEPAPKGYQHVDKLLDGKPATLLLDPTPGGKLYDLNGKPIENAATRIKPIPPAAQATIAQGKTDAQSIADAIESGQQPPTVQGLYRLAGPVRAELANRGYDMTTANLDWEATKKHLSTLNGAQQTRLRQAISTASDSLGVIEGLAQQWDGGKFPLLNKANLALAKGGALGPQAQQIATNLIAQITDVTSELGNVYMGGNSPTDHALSLAGKNLSADWTKDQLLSAIKLARTNLQIRNNSIANAGAITSTPAAAPAVERWERGPDGKLRKVGG